MAQENLKLGRTLILPSETLLQKAPIKIEFAEPHYEVLIAIGKDHTASLIISESALRELNEYKNDVTVEV